MVITSYPWLCLLANSFLINTCEILGFFISICDKTWLLCIFLWELLCQHLLCNAFIYCVTGWEQQRSFPVNVNFFLFDTICRALPRKSWLMVAFFAGLMGVLVCVCRYVSAHVCKNMHLLKGQNMLQHWPTLSHAPITDIAMDTAVLV